MAININNSDLLSVHFYPCENVGSIFLTDIAQEIFGILISNLCHSELEMLIFTAIRFSQKKFSWPEVPFYLID